MSQYIVQTKELSKVYGKQRVLDRVSMQVKKGAIYGFIGLNGAGKSTFLKAIAGLALPSDGEMKLFGVSDKREINNARSRMGVMIEAPALYPHMTAEQNLEVVRIQRGIPGKECIKETLNQVNLAGTGKKKVRSFSLGMKQRLGIAVALISKPELLILDEPINGLDPVGVIEMRQLFKRLNEEYGVTIIISSHILAEVHHIASDYGIIHQGRLIKQCTRAEVEVECQAYLHLYVDDVSRAVIVLEENLETRHFEVLSDNSIKLYSHVNDPARISRLLYEHNIVVEQLTPKNDTLEGFFTRTIKEGV